MKRLGLVVFATFFLIAPKAHAITCDDIVSVLENQGDDFGVIIEQYNAIQGDSAALCRMGREQGRPYFIAAIKSMKRFTGCSLYSDVAKSTISGYRKQLANLEKALASDCKAAGM
ncbi:MAG: hypothetical protein JNK83_07460 [Rhizobiales bacterium]|nr:hypothetical protein [Hyphomicrobiales bacterium]